MSNAIRPVRVNHMNVVIEDFDASVAHFQDLYGAKFLADLPQREWHACLVEMGRVIFELFAPPAFLLNARYGPHYLGLEYQADMDDVRATLAARNIRIARDIGAAVHTHPADTAGASFEFYAGTFHGETPVIGEPLNTAAYWREEHPLGLTGLKGYTVVTADLQETAGFFRDVLSGEVLNEEARPDIGGRAASLQVGDAVVEVIAPVEDGPTQRELARYGAGIVSTLFGVRDLDQARRYFADRNVALVPPLSKGAIAVPPEANLGLRFEFAE